MILYYQNDTQMKQIKTLCQQEKEFVMLFTTNKANSKAIYWQ